MIETIEQYITAGLPVLPLHTWRNGCCTCTNTECTSPAKHPLTRHGKDDATTDPGTVAEWAARWPGCNWGVRPPIGAIIIDVDPRNDGDTTLAELQERHEQLPHTLTASTGSGGLHIWLSYNGPTRGKLGPGVDVKSNSGYVVAPPSIHASGGRYEWLNEAPAAYAPGWVKAILNPPLRRFPSTTGGSIDHLVRFVASSQDGERNRRLFWAACRASEKSLDPAPLIEAATAVGLAAICAEATVRSALNTARRAD